LVAKQAGSGEIFMFSLTKQRKMLDRVL